MSDNDIFTKENLDEYLKKLSKKFRKLNGTKIPAEIILVGGASVLINYGFREKSNDIDALIYASSAMEDAIKLVGEEEGLSRGWLNTDFRRTNSYSNKISLYAKHYKKFSNIVEIKTLSAEYLIAMKLMAGRKYKNDISDVVGIVLEEKNRGNELSLEQVKIACINLYGEYSNIPDDSRILIEKIFQTEDLHKMYDECVSEEKNNKEILLDFQDEYTGILKQSNINEILHSLKNRQKGLS